MLFPDVPGVLAAIRKASFSIGIVSQNRMMSDALMDELKSSGIAHYFDAVVTSEEEGCDKPDPRLFLAASSKLDIPPERLFHVGDIFEKDVAGARAAGMSPVLLDRDGIDTGGYEPKIRRLDELLPIITAR
jgi:putative hydrolase of the HAD superfamily